MQRPLPSEYNPYFQKYISLVGEGNFSALLNEGTDKAIRFFEQIPAEKHNYRYAADKWTIKEVLMHIIDTERVMTYRALVAGRGDSTTPLHPMDENEYARNTDVTARSMDSLLKEFTAVRTASAMLLEHLTEDQTKLPGNTTGHIVTPRAIGYILIGHVQHHTNVIVERYL